MLTALIRSSLTQRLMTLLVALVVVGVGVWSYRELPIDAFPDISSPQVQVIVKAPGMGPIEVEQRITYPIEIEVRGIPQQTVLRSLTKYSLTVITIDFAEGTDIYWARQQVSERISQVLAGLPDGVEGGLAPITMPLSDVYMFLVEGDGYTPRELRSVLDWIIRPQLLGVDGVADVNALGGEVRSFHVLPKPGKLKSFDLTEADLASALERNNRNAGGDRFVQQGEVFVVRTLGQLHGLDDISSITVATRDGAPIHIGDLAEVREGALTRFGGVTANGKGEAVQGLVLNRRGANGGKTVAGVKLALQEIKKGLPKGVRIVPFYDRSELVESAVDTVESALAQSVLLVLVVLFLFLGNLRAALTVGAILPLAVLGAFIGMRQFGLTANLMSLGGLAIAIGILVDSAVVLVENIHSQLSESKANVNRLNLVYRASVEVGGPILSGVLIIIVSLMPIASLTGLEGKLFAPLATTIIFALLASLALSLTVIPALASLLMRGGQEKPNRLLGWMLGLYRPVVLWVLAHRAWALGVALLLLGGSAALFPFIGKEFLPYLDEGTLIVQTEKLPTISLERSMQMDLAMEKKLMELPEVTGIVARVGADELRLDPMGLNEADCFLVTKPRDQWEVPNVKALQNKMRAVLEAFPGVNYGFTQPIDMRVSEMITGVRSAVAIKLQGDSLKVLDQKAQAIEAVLRKVPGAVDIFRTPLNGQSYLTISMRQDAMTRAGVSVDDINALISTSVGGQQVTEIIDGNQRIPVVLRLPENVRNSPEAIADLQLRTANGAMMRLGDLTTIEKIDGPVQIKRENGKRQVVLQANVQGRDVVGFVDELREVLQKEVKLDPGYFVSFGGQFENQQRASGHLLFVIPVSVAVIFLMLFLTFRSLRQALVIVFNIPFALIGGVIVLAVTGLYLSVPASLGFIALLGIAIENGVVMLSYFNQLRQRGMSIQQAVVEGSARRLRPVLMTSVLTILGLVPLLLANGPGSEIQQPLAVVVVGGVFSSTLLTLVLLPIFYAWVEEWAERRSAPVSVPSQAPSGASEGK